MLYVGNVLTRLDGQSAHRLAGLVAPYV